MPFLILASFPNSRIKPRAARTTGNTHIVSIPDSVATLLVPQNNNRTDLVIRNTDTTNLLYYGYTNTVDGITIGFELLPTESINIDGTQDVWIFQSSGGPIVMNYDEGSG